MSDIIVTTPKSKMAEAAREAEECKAAGGGIYYRDYRWDKAPRYLSKGDRVYYVEDGYIRGFAIVFEIKDGLNRSKEIQVVMFADTWRWIKPIPWKAPRSFQYAPADLRYTAEIVGGWLDPRPKVNREVA